MKSLIFLFLALLLSSCATTEEQRAVDDTSCRAYGFKDGTDGFGNCLMRLDAQRKANQRLAIGAALVAASATANPVTPSYSRPAVCFKSGEAMSGFNRICYYNCTGSTYAQTISSSQLCPLSP